VLRTHVLLPPDYTGGGACLRRRGPGGGQAPSRRSTPLPWERERETVRQRDRESLKYQNVQRFRGGLVSKAHRLLYDSTLGSRVIKKKSACGHEGQAAVKLPRDARVNAPHLPRETLSERETVVTCNTAVVY